jgi:small multidrug resistance pump
MTWVLLGSAILSEVAATLALRAATEQPAWTLLVVAGYTAGLVLLAAVLRRGMAIGVAYSIWTACGVLLTAVGAAVLFGDRISVLTGAGLAVLVVGVLVVELAQPAPAHRAAPSEDGRAVR